MKVSLNAQTLAGEVTTGLVRREKTLTDVAARCMDGCYTNSAACDIFDDASEDLGLVVALTALCLSHGINNAGEKANFVLLKFFWSLIQKVFSKSEKAKEIFFSVSKVKWPTHSETCWFSSYDVMAVIF